jgi:cytochrome b involved in lipid metabolism
LASFCVVFAPITASASKSTPKLNDMSKAYTMDDIGKHNNKGDCWFVVNDKVFDVSNFIAKHPGGEKDILNNCGKNATKAFETHGGEGRHGKKAYGLLDNMQIGVLKR